ncbi:MAG: FtsX-like permease family protein [Anaerolineales bacterium]|nr:FtsX-like permease family protein [Anaerolineales bacterium]
MFKLAWRNLIHDRTRLAISTGGVALAIVLILVMAGAFAGSEEHAVSYIRNQPVPLWMMQSGVANMHMSSSLLPPDTVDKVKSVPGVQEAVGLLYANAGVDVGGDLIYSYIFGVDHDVPYGGPWEMDSGVTNLARDEAIIDRDLAARYGVGLGDTIDILGMPLKVAGLSRGTFGIATSITFMNKDVLTELMGAPPQSASYILIQPEAGLNPETLRKNLYAQLPDNNIMTQTEFASSDQEMIRQMGADIINAMNMVSYLVGLLVIGLTIYTATLERAREYSVLKAIGANFPSLMQVVFTQAYISTGLGFLLGTGLSYVIAALISTYLPEMLIVIRPEALARQIPVLIVVTAVASLLPLGRIARLDPVMVFNE